MGAVVKHIYRHRVESFPLNPPLPEEEPPREVVERVAREYKPSSTELERQALVDSLILD